MRLVLMELIVLAFLSSVALANDKQTTTVEVDNKSTQAPYFISVAKQKECYRECPTWYLDTTDCKITSEVCYQLFDFSEANNSVSQSDKTNKNLENKSVTCYQTNCRWECYEWYPNGTDCRRSKQVCDTVCENSFDVFPSGPIAKNIDLIISSAQVQVSGKLTLILDGHKDNKRWNIHLDKPLLIRGQAFKDIEVVLSKPIKFVVDMNNVKINGIIIWRQTQSEGKCPIIKVYSIEAFVK